MKKYIYINPHIVLSIVNMTSQIDLKFILERLDSLQKTVEEMVLANNIMVSRIANNIELKIDILSNADKIINNHKTASNKKVKAKSVFFREEYKKDKEVYMDILYTQGDIDQLYNLEEIKNKKKEEHKVSKICEYLYKKVTQDATKLAELNKHYEAYKIEMESSEDTENNDNDEETKDNS